MAVVRVVRMTNCWIELSAIARDCSESLHLASNSEFFADERATSDAGHRFLSSHFSVNEAVRKATVDDFYRQTPPSLAAPNSQYYAIYKYKRIA